MTHPLRKRRLRQISAYDVSTVSWKDNNAAVVWTILTTAQWLFGGRHSTLQPHGLLLYPYITQAHYMFRCTTAACTRESRSTTTRVRLQTIRIHWQRSRLFGSAISVLQAAIRHQPHVSIYLMKSANGWIAVLEFYFTFYRATACNATHGIAIAILSDRPSICLSVTCVDCDKTKWHTADIFIPHERAITLLLWRLNRKR